MLTIIRENVGFVLGDLERRARNWHESNMIIDEVSVCGRIVSSIDFGDDMVVGIDDGTGSALCYLVPPVAERFRPHAQAGYYVIFVGKFVYVPENRFEVMVTDFIPHDEIETFIT